MGRVMIDEVLANCNIMDIRNAWVKSKFNQSFSTIDNIFNRSIDIINDQNKKLGTSVKLYKVDQEPKIYMMYLLEFMCRVQVIFIVNSDNIPVLASNGYNGAVLVLKDFNIINEESRILNPQQLKSTLSTLLYTYIVKGGSYDINILPNKLSRNGHIRLVNGITNEANLVDVDALRHAYSLGIIRMDALSASYIGYQN